MYAPSSDILLNCDFGFTGRPRSLRQTGRQFFVSHSILKIVTAPQNGQRPSEGASSAMDVEKTAKD
jgi:hypothetical protein